MACEYSSVGGRVDSGGGRNRFLGSWFPLSFSQQTDLILEEKRFPDLVLLWIGHNNLHWEWFVDPRRPEEIETGLQKMAANFRKDYERQLGRLVERAQEQKQRRAFIVFGLVNFKSFFEARDAAEQLRKENPKLYPYFEVDYQALRVHETGVSGKHDEARPDDQRGAARHGGRVQPEIGRRFTGAPRVLGRLATVDLSGVEAIHRIDAWHPSTKGHNVLAEAAFGALRPSLNFLGIVPLQKNTDSR